MYNFTFHILNNTQYTTLYIIHYTLFNINYTLYVHYTMYIIIHYTFYNIHYTLYTIKILNQLLKGNKKIIKIYIQEE